MLLVAIPDLPVPAMLVLLFAATLANPPSQAAQSALLPLILTGDRLVVGLSLNSSVGQAAQVVGYVARRRARRGRPRASRCCSTRRRSACPRCWSGSAYATARRP